MVGKHKKNATPDIPSVDGKIMLKWILEKQ
jgi:hypothetical protein